MVNVGDHVTLNQPLFRIVDFDSIVARIYVPEKELPALATGLDARLTAEAIGGVSFVGSVDRISPVVDPGTGTVKVTVATPRQEGLRPGMYVEVELVTAVHEDALSAAEENGGLRQRPALCLPSRRRAPGRAHQGRAGARGRREHRTSRRSSAGAISSSRPVRRASRTARWYGSPVIRIPEEEGRGRRRRRCADEKLEDRGRRVIAERDDHGDRG